MSNDEPVDGAKIAALILRRMSPEAQERIVKAIQASNPAVAARVEDNLFNFERLTQVGNAAVQTLLREVPHRDLVVSLKGAGEPVREKLFENMSEAKQRLVQEDFSDLPPMRISDVQSAQRRILKKLEDLYPDDESSAPKRPTAPKMA